MEIKTDRYTKVILTIIAVALVMLVFKPQVQQSLTPPPAQAASNMTDENGAPIILTNVYVRNLSKDPVPVKEAGKIEVYWEKPMPVYIVDQKKDAK
jgi:hypothetical protein